MYCPECGYKIEDKDALFCPECGMKVDEEMVQAEPRSHSQSLYGIILTNVSLLAQKFKVSESDVHTCLEHFIQEKEKFGVHYQLVDVSCYAYRKKNILGFPKKLCLKGQASVWTCMDVLMDIHNEEVKEEKPLSRYLFIIGGDDIIPMPCVRHFANDCPDATIDTDILYTYPYGEKALAMLEEGTLFEWNPLFVVGRLPIEKDTSMEDWCGYLERVLKNSGGIPAKGAYAQCDPNWKSVSATVADGLIENDWLRNLDGRLPSDYYFRRLILSPRIDAGSVEQVFRPDASLYYYNLHGSDVLEERAYFGRTTSKLSDFPVLYPEHMRTCTSPNIVVCEACYGARFIGLDKWHSMLLASIYSETLLYVGASRIAWGAEDPHFMTGYEVLMPQCADVVAHTFMDMLMQGYSSGEAMLLARMNLLEMEYTPHALASVVEFNLFGDPSLGMEVPLKATLDMSAYKMVRKGYVMKVLGAVEEKYYASPLQQVRQIVDGNIRQIHSEISRYLYRFYGIEPRTSCKVCKLEFLDGREELNFAYKISSEEVRPTEYVVRATGEGKVKSVIVTK